MHKFNAGDPFPELSGESVNHGKISLPGDIPTGQYAMIQAYRADW